MKICFWGDIEGALEGKTHGGGQMQIALLAKALSKSGHDVVILDYDIRKEFITDDGIRVKPITGWNKGIRMIRTFTHKLPGLYSSLKREKADIYYCRIRNYRHILSYMAARKLKTKFVLGLASDLDILSFRSRWKYLYTKNSRKLWAIFDAIVTEPVYPYLIRKADCVIVQHLGQKEILERKNIRSVIFPNLIEISEVPLATAQVKRDFTYVGRLDKRKGFLEFYDLVRSAQEHTFKVIGPPRHEAGQLYYEKFKMLPNVTMLGELNHRDTLKQIANSIALISTSPMEGFPNIFLEAWACGVPVLSLYVDPGGVIETEKLGVVAHGDMNIMLQAMKSINNEVGFEKRAKSYINKNHVSNEEKIREISILFDEIAHS
ncbi:MAG: glycosyltransferase family 4 protein [Bacteroidales bacterium]|nr:glycosyltransferase family 4 protein [Bacteroidales bacterium]